MIATSVCYAQKDWKNVYSKDDLSRDTITKKGFTLVFINKDSAFSQEVQQHMVNAFFTVYPKEVKLYNKKSLKKVTIIIDPEYEGVAAASFGIIRVNPKWLQQHPQDIDLITHEVMHIVQNYPANSGPGWITEGIADYVRFKFGVNNEAGGWKLPDYSPKQNYQDAYRITARFFVWLEKNYQKKLVKKLDNSMRTSTYTHAFWEKETGKTIDELWAQYSANPALG